MHVVGLIRAKVTDPAQYDRAVELILIRHGRPERIDHDPNGADPALTDLGRRQAQAMADFLATEPLTKIYVSPQRRAQETAEPLASQFGIDPVVVDGIAEFDLGHTHYIPGEERAPMSKEELRELVRDATAPEFVDRVRASTETIISAHHGERVAAVCHGGVISIILNDILGMAIETYHNSSYTSVTRIKAGRNGRRSMASFNESHWLRELS